MVAGALVYPFQPTDRPYLFRGGLDIKSKRYLADAMTSEQYKKWREQFLANTKKGAPWEELCTLIEPF